MKYIDHHNSNIHLAEEVDARERDPFGNACTWNVRHIYTLDGHNHWGQPGRARGVETVAPGWAPRAATIRFFSV